MRIRTAEFARGAWPLALAALLLRIGFLIILPRTAVSNDLPEWERITAALAHGRNPYTTGILAWLPLWLQFLAGLDFVSRATGLEFSYVLRGFLIAVDVFNIVLALRLALFFTDFSAARRALLIGMALNPIELFLLCQHGNFDSVVVTALLTFALALLSFERTREVADWLIAALALATGILLKTIPLLLSPLMAARASTLSRRARLLGLALLFGPAAYGLSIVYVLTPAAVTRYVLRYRSYGGWFGITGILQIAHLETISRLYATAFPLIAIMLLLAIARWLWQTELQPAQLVLMIATMLAGLIAFGPGYGVQYIAWPLPFFVITYAAFDRDWKRDLWTALVVSILTYLLEYGLTADLGELFVVMTGSPALHRISDVLNEDAPKTLLRLPLFAAYVWLVVGGIKRLRPASTSSATSETVQDAR